MLSLQLQKADFTHKKFEEKINKLFIVLYLCLVPHHFPYVLTELVAAPLASWGSLLED